MCNVSGALFGARELSREEVSGARVLEVGSRDLNGSLRPLLASWGPAEYVGVDMVQGPGVDQLCSVDALVETFGAERFDVVVATELLEHVLDWRAGISAMKRVLAPGGVLLVTTRSKGFPYHGAPADFWRYELSDMRSIFGDMEILALESDPMRPGVFMKARKPAGFTEADLSGVKLYNILADARTDQAEHRGLRPWKLATKDRLVQWLMTRGKQAFHRI